MPITICHVKKLVNYRTYFTLFIVLVSWLFCINNIVRYLFEKEKKKSKHIKYYGEVYVQIDILS